MSSEKWQLKQIIESEIDDLTKLIDDLLETNRLDYEAMVKPGADKDELIMATQARSRDIGDLVGQRDGWRKRLADFERSAGE